MFGKKKESEELTDAQNEGLAKGSAKNKRNKDTRGGDKKKSAKNNKKNKRDKKDKKNKGLYRIEELEDRIAKGELDDIDEEAIVSMYMPKRRFQRIGAALLRLGTLQKILIILLLVLATLFALSFLQERMGNFTVNLNRLELYRRGISIADNPDFNDATAKLTADAVINGTNISIDDIPGDVDNIDGSHNGTNYMAYTFYIRNAGKEDLDYEGLIKLESSAKGAEKAVRVMVWKNDEPMLYAAPASDGGTESGCTNFLSDNVAATYTQEDFKVGYVDKYTVVIWMEGDDPECIDDIIGGEVEFSMQFQAIDHDDSNLFMKFVEDIVDTLTGNNPISSSGNDAPDFYNQYEVTWDSRRNQDNPPPGANG